MTNPLRYQLSSAPEDPFALKSYSKWSPTRAIWTLQSRVLQKISAAKHQPMHDILPQKEMAHFSLERGDELEDTAVTSGQIALLEAGTRETEGIASDIAEVGSYRGVSTLRIAQLTSRKIHAVDPFVGYGGVDKDLEVFRQRTGKQANITHHRLTSGQAMDKFAPDSLSFIFVDAIHDVSNSWFDITHWSRRIKVNGILAMHDVDDHSGSNMSARRFMEQNANFHPWAYCPNILLLKRES